MNRHVLLWTSRASFAGGAEAYVHAASRGIRARGYRTTLLFDPNETTDAEFLLGFDAAFPAVDPEAQLEGIRPDVVYLHQVNQEAVDIAAASDVPSYRFLHDHELFCLRRHKLTTLAGATCTRAVGWRCHSCLGGVQRTATGLGWRSLRQLRGELESHWSLDGVIVGSGYMARQCIDHGFDPGKVHRLPLFAMRPIRQLTHVQRDRNHLLYVGALTRGKGLDVLLRAMRNATRDCTLDVVGTGPQEGSYRRLARRLGLADRVSFAGELSAAQLVHMYRRSGALVMPARAPETFGLVGVEAMSYGLPVIASLIGGVHEWLRPGLNGFAVRPGDPRDLGAALDTLLAAPARAAAMGGAGRQLWSRHFRPEIHFDALASTLAHADRKSGAA